MVGVGQQLESVVVGQMLEVEPGKRMAGMVIFDCIDNKKVVAVAQRMVGLVVSKVGKEIRMVVVVGFAAERLEEIEVDIDSLVVMEVVVDTELMVVVEVVVIDIGSLEVFVEFEEDLNIVPLVGIVEVMELGLLVV